MPPKNRFEKLPIPRTVDHIEGLSKKDNASYAHTIFELKKKGGIFEDLSNKLRMLGPSGRSVINTELKRKTHTWENLLEVETETEIQFLESIVENILRTERENYKDEITRERALEKFVSDLHIFLVDNLA